MRTHTILKKNTRMYDKDTRECYTKEVNIYVVQLTEKEYKKAKRIFKEE